MPRQPFLPFVLKHRDGQLDVGTHALQKHPDIELLIAHCLMAWPAAEAEMAFLLAHLLGAEQSEAALAVYQSIRRSQAQRDAISEAARITLSDANQELLAAIMAAHKAVELERNSLAHGHFGTYSLLKDGIVWMNTKSYLDARIRAELVRQVMTEAFLVQMYKKTFVYKASDIQKIFDDIKDIADIWHTFMRYLRVQPGVTQAGQLYNELYARPRIARELETLRRKAPHVMEGDL